MSTFARLPFEIVFLLFCWSYVTVLSLTFVVRTYCSFRSLRLLELIYFDKEPVMRS